MLVPPLNILVLGDSHVFWLDSYITSDGLAERFGELQMDDRACHVDYLGIRGATVSTFLTPNMRAQSAVHLLLSHSRALLVSSALFHPFTALIMPFFVSSPR